MTDEQVKQIQEADAAGTAWAEGLAVGDKFIGCGQAAEAAGFTGLARQAFIASALSKLDAWRSPAAEAAGFARLGRDAFVAAVLPKLAAFQIHTDLNGFITSLTSGSAK